MRIVLQEFMTICKNLTDEQVKAAFKQFDTSGDDKLDYREFCEMINKREREGNWCNCLRRESEQNKVFFHIASISLRHYLHDETLLSSINININIYIESMLCKMFALCVLLEFRDVSLFINSCPLDWNFILRIVEKISHSFCFISIIFEIFIKYIFTLKRLFVEFSLLIIIYIIFTWIWYK